MQSFLFTKDVKKKALDLIDDFKRSNSYSLPPDKEKYPLSDLRETQMFAIMIAMTSTGEEKILYGYSGSINGSYRIPGYVPPCFSVTEFEKIVEINDKKIHDLTDRIENGEEYLTEERARLSNETLARLKSIYTFYSYSGERISCNIDKAPTGTGDCAGLKLINHAMKKHYEIKALAEFRLDGTFWPPCEERCAPLLAHMLGLRFLYADEDIAVIDKPEGLLSVPGRGAEKLDSASYRFHTLFPSSPEQCSVHRLDMDTSGLLILAFNKESVKKLSIQFEKREVKKSYIAMLEGVIKEDNGIIDLPLRLDVDNRPYQIVDYKDGKNAITRWEKINVAWVGDEKCTRVRFYPQTGRTHQLRVHAASGLMHPIKGDRLYGNRKDGERLYLHAESITFKHPRTGEEMTFSSKPEF